MTELANTITPYSWFYPLYIHASETNDNILPSKLEILFLSDTGASISVLNLPTFHVISKQLNINVPTNLQNKRAKTLTVANQTEVPIIHYISMTCFTEVNHKTRSFNLDFAVANIKYNILGTPFFKKHIQNIDFQQNIMTYTEQHPKLSTKTTFSTFTEKDYPNISYIYTIKCKEPIHFKPRSGKTIHFPIKNYSNLHFELEDNTKFYPTNPYTYFLQKFKNIFHFLDMIVNEKSKDSCATIIQNFTSYPATLPRGIIGYIEIPITQTTPPHYRFNDVNSLIHSVIHAYHPDTTTPIKQIPYSDMNLCTRVIPQSLLEINKIEINDKTLQLPIPSVTGNLRPSDKIRKDFPPLPYSTENQQFIKKFNFKYSDLTDTEYVNLCNILINNQNCYAKHKNDVGKISTPFRIRIKDNCKLHTQRPSKVPIHYRDRLNKLLLELEKYNIIKQIGSTTDEKHTIGTTFLNPLIIIPKGDAIKVVLDARHLNSNTNQELESWPIEPLAPQLARANKKYKSTIDLMYAYAHTPLDEETIKLTGFSSGDKLYAFIRGFYGLKGLPNFFTKQMSTFFRSLIDKRSALVYIDDILLLAKEKQEMFELIKELHTIASPYRSPYRNNSNYRYNSRSRYRSRSQSQGNSFKRYNYPYRSPSRPRDFRSRSRTPSRNRQQNRINQVDVKSPKENDSTKFEIHTCQMTELANTITPYSWFYPLYIHASETNDNILPSKLEILFLSDTGASISVLNLPTFHVISKQLNINVPTNLQNKRAKTLTVANQTEVPIIHYISMTCFTEVNHKTRSFNIDFAVANIKYNILGTPFFKKHIQNIDFQQNIMTYTEQHPKLSTKNYIFYIYRKRLSKYFLHLYY